MLIFHPIVHLEPYSQKLVSLIREIEWDRLETCVVLVQSLNYSQYNNSDIYIEGKKGVVYLLHIIWCYIW